MDLMNLLSSGIQPQQDMSEKLPKLMKNTKMQTIVSPGLFVEMTLSHMPSTLISFGMAFTLPDLN